MRGSSTAQSVSERGRHPHGKAAVSSRRAGGQTRLTEARVVFTDTPAQSGWSHHRQWRKALKRWNNGTDVPVWRKGGNFLKLLGWNTQVGFDDVPESVLASEAWLDTVLPRMDFMIGEREGGERRRAGRKALFEAARDTKESLTHPVARRESQFFVAEASNLRLSP
ncbi:unnamed protein product [Prorocentrum cordatum]|uniref:Uncharacterized protein n=1 Tax=Prorocentrum cordatum TaxID=2364126 RepID=A0ABN9VJ79_9DINO|nr:unnamed protein product [Polarella glacialis]